jgi:hypothetical protein
MIKKIIIEELYSARRLHENWLNRTEDLISGLPIYEDMIPLSPTTCGFGKWFQTKCQDFHKIPQLAISLKRIDRVHNELHYIYFKIYKIYFIDSKRPWLLSAITSAYKEPSKKQKELAYEYYEELEETSIKLMAELKIFERDIQRTKEIFLEKNYKADEKTIRKHAPLI